MKIGKWKGTGDKGRPDASKSLANHAGPSKGASAPHSMKVGWKKEALARGTSSGHRQCDHCEGTRVGGMWIHSARCPYTVVLWKPHGFRRSDWVGGFYQCCPYQCEPQEMPSCFTHAHSCPFWDRTGLVPFGWEKPKGKPLGEPPEVPPVATLTDWEGASWHQGDGLEHLRSRWVAGAYRPPGRQAWNHPDRQARLIYSREVVKPGSQHRGALKLAQLQLDLIEQETRKPPADNPGRSTGRTSSRRRTRPGT